MTSPKILYDILFNTFGQQYWWPIDRQYHHKQKSDPRFEIIIGAILTQNTAWTNVEKALDNLKRQKALTIQIIAHIDDWTLKTMIQPSGFFNQKAERLKRFTSHIEEKYAGDLQEFFSHDTLEIRKELLSLHGIGPETADSILLYAGNHAVFVVDSYTKRICQRFPFPVDCSSYEDIQLFFENALCITTSKKEMVPIFKEFHALLVKLAKEYCWKNKPHCITCPLTNLCKKLL